MRRIQLLVKDTLRNYQAHRPFEVSAALSYYTLLSLAPLVLVTVSLAGLVFGRDAVANQIVGEMRGLVGDAGAEVASTVLRNAGDPAQGKISLIVGLGMLLVGATTVFVELQDALNRIWEVEARPKKSAIWGFVRGRLLSMALVLGIGFLLLVSLVISAALSALGEWASASLGAVPMLLNAINATVSLAVTTLLFAMIFRVLPDAKIAWRHVWFGAFMTSLCFTIGKQLIGLYLGRASVGSAYGAAGSLVVMLVWVYYAALIVLFGAELTRARARREQARVEPAEHAVRAGPALR
jgi:membrane protein